MQFCLFSTYLCFFVSRIFSCTSHEITFHIFLFRFLFVPHQCSFLFFYTLFKHGLTTPNFLNFDPLLCVYRHALFCELTLPCSMFVCFNCTYSNSKYCFSTLQKVTNGVSCRIVTRKSSVEGLTFQNLPKLHWILVFHISVGGILDDHHVPSPIPCDTLCLNWSVILPLCFYLFKCSLIGGFLIARWIFVLFLFISWVKRSSKLISTFPAQSYTMQFLGVNPWLFISRLSPMIWMVLSWRGK